MENELKSEKILDLSLEDFVKISGIQLKNYKLLGVHGWGTLNKAEIYSDSYCTMYLPNPLDNLRKGAPLGTEWIIGYKILAQDKDIVIVYGTALIPKR